MSERKTPYRRGPQSPLTIAQKRALSMLANKLWDENVALRMREWSGEVTKSRQAEAWRQRGVRDALGIASLTEAIDSQYLAIRGTILGAAGLSAEALKDFLKDSKVKGRGAEEDTRENRGRWMWKIENALRTGLFEDFELYAAEPHLVTANLHRASDSSEGRSKSSRGLGP